MAENTNETVNGKADDMFDMIRGWAKTRGIYENGDVKTQFIKLQEETGEIARAIIKKDQAEIEDGIGDAVVVLTNLAHLAGTSIEECMYKAWIEIKNRKGSMQNGSFVKQETINNNGKYECIGLQEDDVYGWKGSFTKHKYYRCTNKGVNFLELEGDEIGVNLYVSPSQFRLIE